MYIHNLLEEIVIARVNDLIEDIKKAETPWFTCDCQQCRLDIVCYVLNKLPPRYIVSSRGVTYSQQHTLSNQQLTVDIDSIIINGMKQIMSTQRPHHQTAAEPKAEQGKPAFNFPAIVGNIVNGKTFEPVYDVQVLLKTGGLPCEMFDSTWQNPCHIVKNTAGTFTFWPKSVPAEQPDEKKLFSFEISVNAGHFAPLTSCFDLEITSSAEPNLYFNAQDTYKVQNLYVFPE